MIFIILGLCKSEKEIAKKIRGYLKNQGKCKNQDRSLFIFKRPDLAVQSIGRLASITQCHNGLCDKKEQNNKLKTTSLLARFKI